MNRFTLTLLAALSLGGCTAEQQAQVRTGWARGVATGTRFREQVLAPTLQATGQAMVAYSNGVAEYEYTHPIVTVYQELSFIQPATYHATPTGLTLFGEPTYNITSY